MSSLVKFAMKATIGILVNKGRDLAAEKLKQGDVTNQKLRDMIVREITDVKSKLDGLARKDLLAAIEYFEEGLVLFDDAFHSKIQLCSNTEAETVFSAQAIGKLKLSDLDESATVLLCNAKNRFADARRKALEAFCDEALNPSDRVTAMGYRVMATILEAVDNLSAALASCRLCIERLHSLPAVQNCFTVELKKGFRGWFSKDERREIISVVCLLNRVVYDVTIMSYGFGNIEVSDILQMWPCIEVDEEKINPLLDSKVARTLQKLGMKHCPLHWSFGQEGKEEHKLKDPWGIATNAQGQFLVADNKPGSIKVFDSSGKFLYSFRPVADVADEMPGTAVFIHDIATDKNSNIFVLVTLNRPGTDDDKSYVYMKTPNSSIPLKEGFRPWSWTWASLVVTGNDKVLVRGELVGGQHVIAMYTTDGKFVRRFGKGKIQEAFAVTPANDGCSIVASSSHDSYFVNTFNEKGKRLRQFKVEKSFHYPQTTFHQASEHVVVAGIHEEQGKQNRLVILIYTKQGEFVRSVEHEEEGDIVYLRGISVSIDGRIAVVIRDKLNFKVLVV